MRHQEIQFRLLDQRYWFFLLGPWVPIRVCPEQFHFLTTVNSKLIGGSEDMKRSLTRLFSVLTLTLLLGVASLAQVSSTG